MRSHKIQPQIFFRPEELKRERIHIRADVFNRCRLLLTRCERDHAFLPIRSMQVLAVIAQGEILFVDSEAYAVRDGEGGRMILLAWQRMADQPRESITAPVAVDLVHYDTDQTLTQRRLMAELPKAAELLLSRQQVGGPLGSAKILSL